MLWRRKKPQPGIKPYSPKEWTELMKEISKCIRHVIFPIKQRKICFLWHKCDKNFSASSWICEINVCQKSTYYFWALLYPAGIITRIFKCVNLFSIIQYHGSILKHSKTREKHAVEINSFHLKNCMQKETTKRNNINTSRHASILHQTFRSSALALHLPDLRRSIEVFL